MLVYAESRHSDDTVTLDVSKEDDLEPVLRRATPHENSKSARDKRSMILVEGLKTHPYAGFREGFWYDLPERIWDEFDLEPFGGEQSLIYRVRAHAPGSELNFCCGHYCYPLFCVPLFFSIVRVPKKNPNTSMMIAKSHGDRRAETSGANL